MLHIHDTFKSFEESYKHWTTLPPDSFAFSHLREIPKNNKIILVEYTFENRIPSSRKFIAVEREIVIKTEKDAKYFFNKAKFYSEAFPYYHIVCAPYSIPECFDPNLSIISLLIPLEEKHEKVVKTINWFNIMKTPA